MSRGPYSNWKLRQFSRLFEEGGVFAYPTESVYGVGCDPLNGEAVERLLGIKQRSWTKGVILIASSVEQLEPWVVLRSAKDRKRLATPQPRPTTWLVAAADGAPRWITGLHQKVAVRITTFPAVVQLCESVDSPLVSTSANLAGHPAARDALMVRNHLGNQLDRVLSGETGGVAKPSEIRDFDSQQVVRAG